MRPTKTKINLKTFFYALLWIAVIGAGLFVVVVRPLQIRNQKAQFDKAEASLDALVLEIEAKIGKADEVKKEKSCGRANLKNAEGPLICSVSVDLLFASTDVNSANGSLQKLLGSNNKKLRIGSAAAEGTSFLPTSEKRSDQTFFQDFQTASEPSCAYSYRYPANEGVFKLGGENFEVGMTCGGPAFKEYYPLK